MGEGANAGRLLALGALVLAVWASPVWAGEVTITFHDGRVSIIAADATPRQILAEWARLGAVNVTNLDRLAGGPVSLQLVDVPEGQAIATLLRGTAGFIAAPRSVDASIGASRYEKLLLLPGIAPPPGAVSAPPAPAARGDAMPRGRGVRPFPGGAAGRPDGFLAPDGTFPGSAAPVAPGGSEPVQPSGGAAPPSGQSPASGSSVPGLSTAPTKLETSPYPGMTPASPATVPTGQARPGVPTAPAPTSFRNPYGLPDQEMPPAKPNASPYGPTLPVKPGQPPTAPDKSKQSPSPGSDGQV